MICYNFFFFSSLPYFAFDKTKVLVLRSSAFSPKTSLEAHADMCSVSELHLGESTMVKTNSRNSNFYAIGSILSNIISDDHTSIPSYRVHAAQRYSCYLTHMHATLSAPPLFYPLLQFSDQCRHIQPH